MRFHGKPFIRTQTGVFAICKRGQSRAADVGPNGVVRRLLNQSPSVGDALAKTGALAKNGSLA